MTLPELCIKRPVFATVLSLAVLLIGLISNKKSELYDVFHKHHVTTFLKKPFYASNFLGLIQGFEDSKED